jgi:hypothetical protein
MDNFCKFCVNPVWMSEMINYSYKHARYFTSKEKLVGIRRWCGTFKSTMQYINNKYIFKKHDVELWTELTCISIVSYGWAVVKLMMNFGYHIS